MGIDIQFAEIEVDELLAQGFKNGPYDGPTIKSGDIIRVAYIPGPGGRVTCICCSQSGEFCPHRILGEILPKSPCVVD